MRSRRSVTALAVAAAVACSACASQSSSSQRATDAQASSTAAPTSRSPHKRPARHPRRRRPAHGPALAAHPSGLPLSNASSTVVQPQPDPGACHATGSGKFSEPDPSCTPGALNPAVTQATIDQTICMSGYSESVRPPERITNKEKLASMAAYGDSGSPSDYEYDHLVSLELGGAANDPRNLWPEPGNSPNPKDSIENSLHRLVCSGEMPLAQAQKIIATRWIAYYRSNERQAQASPSPSAPSSAPTRRAGPTSRSRRSTARTSRRMLPPRAGSIDTAALRATTSPASTATTTASPANRSRRPGVPKTTGAAPAGGRRRPPPGPHGSR